MNNPAEQWMQQAARARGMLACAVQLADKSIVVRLCRDDLSKPRIEEAMRRISDASQKLQQAQVPTNRLRWTFENGQIHCAINFGGAIAALFVNKDLARPEALELLLANFTAS
jgi:hypothetical protein